MAKFYGKIGFTGPQVESAPGVWDDVITEKHYRGDVVRNSRKLSEGENLNKDLSVSNSISIVADPYASENFHAMRYIEWAGTLWIVSDVDATNRPRLILRLGGVYNGPTPTPDEEGDAP